VSLSSIRRGAEAPAPSPGLARITVISRVTAALRGGKHIRTGIYENPSLPGFQRDELGRDRAFVLADNADFRAELTHGAYRFRLFEVSSAFLELVTPGGWVDEAPDFNSKSES
jgi:hypothetical protein